MPTTTFLNLTEAKRNRFIEVALKEFSNNNFERASINQIIKELGIARGSVYQYFEDKLDLWLFLKNYSEQEKLKHIIKVNRSDYSSFWDYYRALYISGIDFDLESPLCSRFLYRIGFKENSPELDKHLNTWKNKANEMFTVWVNEEKKKGAFNKKLSTELIVHFLITMSLSIADLLQTKYKVDFDKNIKSGKPIYAKNKKQFISAVNDLISVLEKALK